MQLIYGWIVGLDHSSAWLAGRERGWEFIVRRAIRAIEIEYYMIVIFSEKSPEFPYLRLFDIDIGKTWINIDTTAMGVQYCPIYLN